MPSGVYIRTEEYRKNMSRIMKGKLPWMKGKKHIEESKIKMSLALKGRKGSWLGKKLSKEHKERIHPNSFTAKYNVDILVWYEAHPYIARAIAREKQIKAGSRKKKEALINAANPEWKDLYEEL